MLTRKEKGSELNIYEGIHDISVCLSLVGPMQAKQPYSSESAIQQNSPKFSIPGAVRFVLHTQYQAVEWFYWQINLSELNPTAKVTKNLFVITSFSTSDSEESTTLRMKWYLTVIQAMSSMILVALKQVEHQSWMLSRASYISGQQQKIWKNSYMQYGEKLSNDTQMYLNTVCLGTASQ